MIAPGSKPIWGGCRSFPDSRDDGPEIKTGFSGRSEARMELSLHFRADMSQSIPGASRASKVPGSPLNPRELKIEFR